MELLYDLVLPPIVGFILAKIIQRLPDKIQVFLGSIIIALIAAPLTLIFILSVMKPDFDQAFTAVQVLFVVILFATFFGIIYFQSRRKKHVNQNQFQLASDLIRSYQFQKALDTLATINDPLARQWEAIVTDMIHNDPQFLQHLESI